eukprot:3594827-Karenia_brevis.AAC.1
MPLRNPRSLSRSCVRRTRLPDSKMSLSPPQDGSPGRLSPLSKRAAAAGNSWRKRALFKLAAPWFVTVTK